MAIVNVTPDSFSDGGRWLRDDHHLMLETVGAWVSAGAELVDVGGESTRPGSEAVAPDEEQARVVPVIAALRAHPATASAIFSVDTRHAATAEAALAAGADVINDVSGLADPRMADTVARHGAGLVIGHMRGTPTTMMEDTRFAAPFDQVSESLGRAVTRARAAGVAEAAIVVDPCLGFGKSAMHSAAWLAWPRRLEAAVGRPVLIGASRKRFIGAAVESSLGVPAPPPEQRLAGSLAAALLAMRSGARIVRVHDVRATLEARAVAHAVTQAAARGGLEVGDGLGDGAAAMSTAALSGDASARLTSAVVGWARGRAGLGRGGLLVLSGAEDVADASLVVGRMIDAQVDEGDVLDEDGALVVLDARGRGPRLARVGEVLPLATAGWSAAQLGLRHRAAAGLTARCDALVVVVAESTGTIRLAHGGRVGSRLTELELGAAVERWIRTGEATGRP